MSTKLTPQEENDYKYLLDTYGNHIANTFKQQILSLKHQREKTHKKRKDKALTGVLPKAKQQEVAKLITIFRREFNSTDGEGRLALLKHYAGIEAFKFKGVGLILRRKAFEEDKSLALPTKSVCCCCGERATERHHVIQLQNGGTNVNRNLVPVCSACHAEIHPWLQAE